jgi:hypothetical protein
MRPALLSTLVLLTACTHSLHLRPEASTLVEPLLQGVAVSVDSVRDLRPRPRTLGRHRDGLLRVRQWTWVASPSLAQSARAMLLLSLQLSGARVVPPSDAQVHLALEVLEADVTDDGELAGRETFGEVAVRLVATGASEVVRAEGGRFANDTEEDAGLLGAALFDAICRAVGHVPVPQVPPT